MLEPGTSRKKKKLHKAFTSTLPDAMLDGIVAGVWNPGAPLSPTTTSKWKGEKNSHKRSPCPGPLPLSYWSVQPLWRKIQYAQLSQCGQMALLERMCLSWQRDHLTLAQNAASWQRHFRSSCYQYRISVKMMSWCHRDLREVLPICCALLETSLGCFWLLEQMNASKTQTCWSSGILLLCDLYYKVCISQDWYNI